MADKIVKLSRRYEAFGEAFDQLSLREPTGADYWALGPIAEWQPAGEGQALITYHDRIKVYAERLVGGDPASSSARLAALSLADTLKVEQVVRDFFMEANRSARPPTS